MSQALETRGDLIGTSQSGLESKFHSAHRPRSSSWPVEVHSRGDRYSKAIKLLLHDEDSLFGLSVPVSTHTSVVSSGSSVMYIPFEVPREASRSNTTSTVLGAPRKLVAAESSADKKKRQALISTVIEHGDRGRIDPQIASTMCTIVEALPASALDPDIVISEDGTIEFDWESETGGGAFTIGVIPTGKVIYDWVWGPDQTSGRTELEGGELHGFIKCCLNELGQKLSHGV